ncbi:MAG: TatD family hydrolase [Prolixibacteraceae bacterium]|jgi:TatD DNase family protein|nr:TatD family hydrolase [Prolixibacteraceae bacterium]MBT6007513.1 TatD family hydrolase [Prolixibacteraceae bacterium]MBT6763961.1 TatD family hydrolase [Prolixibacteraceae bacterium]MBT7000004.1 TatD family hydrolase [Prolixibacteraceae bacterium]MBT7395480.1 TatD family hydrolase [Prolixibacteraceae bacterium]
MLIDTHSHIYLEDFLNDVDEVIQRAYNNDVKKIVLPNIDSGSVKRLNDLSDAFPHLCYPLIGLHPTSVSSDYKKELQAVEYWLEKRKYYGIGEIGIDLYWDSTYINEQKDAFRHQIKLAKSNNLPIIIHLRNSFQEVYEIVNEEQNGTLKGIFHCFSGNESEAQQVIDLGFLLGIGGVATFKNSNLNQVIEKIGLEHLVLETDSPYLSPVPKRGQRNESSYLVYIAQKVAEIYKIPVEKVAGITTANARNLFGI